MISIKSTSVSIELVGERMGYFIQSLALMWLRLSVTVAAQDPGAVWSRVWVCLPLVVSEQSERFGYSDNATCTYSAGIFSQPGERNRSERTLYV